MVYRNFCNILGSGPSAGVSADFINVFGRFNVNAVLRSGDRTAIRHTLLISNEKLRWRRSPLPDCGGERTFVKELFCLVIKNPESVLQHGIQ